MKADRIKYPNVSGKFFSIPLFLLLIVPLGLPGQESTHLIQPSKLDNTKNSVILPDQMTRPSEFIKSVEEYIQLNQAPPGEKIFLHLDRPNYIQGDTIWFKAYSWYGYDQKPDTVSGVLNIDLINPEGRIKLKRKLLIQNGTSQGDFCVDSTITPGRYTLRAYTRWIQNVNTGEPFYQTITINPADQNFQVECVPVIIKQAGNDSLQVSFRFFEISRTGEFNNTFNHEVNYSLKIGDRLLQTGNIMAGNTKEQVFKCSLAGINQNDSVALFGISINDNSLCYAKQFQIPLKEDIDIQFFPEGGKLVTGLESKVAFKTIGTDGLCREVNGEIETDKGMVVASFESTHKGMGAFLLKPEANERYFAHLLFKNRNYIIPLPPASEKGCTMSVSYTGNVKDSYLSIKQEPSEANAQKYVIGSAYGKIWFSALVKIAKDSYHFRIPLELMPEGVCRLTVLNGNFEPVCERLIFVDKDQRFKIEVKPDSLSYDTRSKVTLLIKTTGPGGVPMQTDMSLAVVDKEQITKDVKFNGICAYKLLESELKGYIEDVDYYFKDDSCVNHDALDLLLLTQGYRKFISGSTNPDKLKFQPEKSFDISGKIKFSGSKSREKKFNYRDIGLTLMCRSDGVYLDQSNPDSLGQFRFKIPLLYGKNNSLLGASTPKGKPFYGEILLDENTAPYRFEPPPTTRNNRDLPAVEYINQLQAITKTEISKNPAYGVKTLNLPEVTVTARAKNWYHNFEKEAIKIANLDSLDPTGSRYRNIYDLLVEEFGARRHTRPSLQTILLPSFKCDGALPYFFPIYVIDEKIYWNGEGKYLFPLESLSGLHVNEIKKVMVLPPGDILSQYYASVDFRRACIYQSLVVIETYHNDWYRGDSQGIKTFILDGLDAPRVFYSPRYDGPLKNSPVYDGRATLYWQPSIRTDSTGQAKVEFFTSDRKTSLVVIVNGIEVGSGNPGQGRAIINSVLSH